MTKLTRDELAAIAAAWDGVGPWDGRPVDDHSYAVTDAEKRGPYLTPIADSVEDVWVGHVVRAPDDIAALLGHVAALEAELALLKKAAADIIDGSEPVALVAGEYNGDPDDEVVSDRLLTELWIASHPTDDEIEQVRLGNSAEQVLRTALEKESDDAARI